MNSTKPTDNSSMPSQGAARVTATAPSNSTSAMDVDVAAPAARGPTQLPSIEPSTFVGQPSFLTLDVDPEGEYERRHRSSSLDTDDSW